MERDILRTADIARGRIPDVYDLTIPGMKELLAIGRTDMQEAIYTAYQFGFVLGSRAKAKGKFSERAKRGHNWLDDLE